MVAIGPAHIDLIPWGTWYNHSFTTPARAQNSGALTGGYFNASGASIGNFVTWHVPLTAGTWTVTLIYRSSTASGVVGADLDGEGFATTVDMYNGSTVYNNVHQWTGVTVLNAGIKEFSLTSDAKNASSSSYFIGAQLITFSNEDDPSASFTCTGPSRFDIIPFGFWETAVGSPTRAQSASSLMGGSVQTTNQNDSVGWILPLTAGTWALDVLCLKGPAFGIATVTIDGSTVATLDFYNGSNTFNNVMSQTGIVVATSKYSSLNFTMATKNASSSSYTQGLASIALRKTA